MIRAAGMSWTALLESRWATRSCTTTWGLRSGATDDRHPVPRTRHRHGGRCARQGDRKPCGPRAWMGVDAESQSVLRRPGYLVFTYPREVETFTWVPRPAPLGIAAGTSDGVSDVVTTASRSPLPLLPIDDVGPTFHVWRTLHETSPAVRGLTQYHHTESEAEALARRRGTTSDGRDAEPVERVPARRQRRPLRPRDRRDLEALPQRSDGCGSSAVGGAPTRRTPWSNAAARRPTTSSGSSVLARADDLVQ